MTRPSRTSEAASPVMSRALRRLLTFVAGLGTVLAASGLYLAAVRVVSWSAGRTYESTFSLAVFLAHVVLGLVFVMPTLAFAVAHLRRGITNPNRRAVRAGLALLTTLVVLMASGVVLTRLEGVLDIADPRLRSAAYWTHVLTPLVAGWLFVLHRLAGPPIRWRRGGWLAAATAGCVAALVALQFAPGRLVAPATAPTDVRTFAPSLARTGDGRPIAARDLDNDTYCQQCHSDVHERWLASAHHLSSFNNPAYRFSVLETRRELLERDGDVVASRFCAGCHDPVPLFSGRFDDPDFDDRTDPTAAAGITCSTCHAITAISSPRGNSDYVISRPQQYPFTYSTHPVLQWLNRQLVKGKPELHKATFLKPLHRSPEFCGTCHKVHIPEELNAYKWLRGQNHYDSFLLSGVSGHGVAAFYFPPRAVARCGGCHMPLREAAECGARDNDDSGRLTVHDHLFPAANTALPDMVGMKNADEIIAAHRDFLRTATRVDIFGLRDGGGIDAPLIAPLRPEVPTLEAGRRYLVEVVIRTLGVGHQLTQGTADSNQLWLEISAEDENGLIGRSGAIDELGRVDPGAHFVNAYVIDRQGNRIDRRNVQDIFIALYDNQIPPGAAAVVHYLLVLPADARGAIELHAALRYRKFDSTYLEYITGEHVVNGLPVVTMAEDSVRLPIAAGESGRTAEEAPPPEWERWNDYGIGLLLRGGRGELRQAEDAFRHVEALGRADGPLNLARVYLREGRVTRDAPEALMRAATIDPPAPAWSLLWFGGLVDVQNGNLDRAIRNFEQILDGGFAGAVGRGFDFSSDYRVLLELGRALHLRALRERGEDHRMQRRTLLEAAASRFEEALDLDPENLAAHWGLKQVFDDLGDHEAAARHAAAHARYKPDDNARDRATTAARRRDPDADRAAGSVVIHELR
jgi:hypothetical protein